MVDSPPSLSLEILDKYRVKSGLQSVYYVPDFITALEESSLVSNINATKMQWVQVSCQMGGPAAKTIYLS